MLDFHFIRPLWLIALVIPVFVYLRYFKGLKNKSSWENVCDKHLLNFLIVRDSANNRKILGYISMVGLISSILILATPVWNKKDIPTITKENPSIILLSLSSDMMEKDDYSNKLAKAKYKIEDLINEDSSSQMGLIVYSDEPFIITPITGDKNIIKNILPNVDISIMPSNGDNLYRAIDLAVQSFENSKFSTGNIIIFASDVGENFDKAIASAKKAKSKNHPIYIINMSPEKNEKLGHIAQASNGMIIDVSNDNNDIEKITNEISKHFNDELKLNDNLTNIWIEYGYYFLFIPLICCLAFFRKGILIVLFTLSFSSNVLAGFFQNNNQEGLELFNNQNYEAASKKFDNPKWLASSLYKAGAYDKALEYFSQFDDETSVYNQGNALAKSGKIEDAIKKYEEVLEKNPNHEDAKFNLEYLKQQQNNQNSSNNNQDKSEDEKENSSQNQTAQNQEENKEKQDSQSQSQNSDEQEKNDEDQNGEQEQENQNLEQKEGPEQDKQQETKAQKNGDNSGEEKEGMSEEIQQREQTYRKIPENPGGLLRAFIKKEYLKRKYRN